MKSSFLSLTLALVVSCGGSDEPSPDAAIAKTCGNVMPSCPASAEPLGTPGGFGRNTKSVTFELCEKGEYAYAPFVYFDVPGDIISLSATLDAGETKGGFMVAQIGDEPFINLESLGQGPHGHLPAQIAGSFVMPIDLATNPQQGCLALMPIADPAAAGKTATVDIASRRGGNQNLLDVNIIVVEGVDIFEIEIDEAINRMFDIYYAAGAPDLGFGELYTTDAVSTKIMSEGADVNKLRALEVGGSSRAINIFLVADLLDSPGTLGFAAGIPGPNGVTGTAGSGVVVAVDSHRIAASGDVDTETLGETLAHEIGHQMGLFHTTEADASSHDFLPDTPECQLSDDTDGDGQLSASECQAKDGSHVMFWVSGLTQTEISPSQVHVLKNSPVAY